MDVERIGEAADLPAPTADRVLIRVAIEAYLSTSSRRQARAFIRAASEILADEESVALLFPIRPHSEHSAVSGARRGAIAIWRQLLPTLNARIPPR